MLSVLFRLSVVCFHSFGDRLRRRLPHSFVSLSAHLLVVRLSLVIGKPPSLHEGLIAPFGVAFVGLVTCVEVDVVSQVLNQTEFLATIVTNVLLLRVVDKVMPEEAVFAAVDSLTAMVWTHDFFPIVDLLKVVHYIGLHSLEVGDWILLVLDLQRFMQILFHRKSRRSVL